MPVRPGREVRGAFQMAQDQGQAEIAISKGSRQVFFRKAAEQGNFRPVFLEFDQGRIAGSAHIFCLDHGQVAGQLQAGQALAQLLKQCRHGVFPHGCLRFYSRDRAGLGHSFEEGCVGPEAAVMAFDGAGLIIKYIQQAVAPVQAV